MPEGGAVLVLAAGVFSISLGLSELVRRLCLRWGFLDWPAPDRWHRTPRPRLGGIAIFASLAFAAVVWSGRPVPRSAACLIIGATFVFAWGLVDDLRRLPVGIKLLMLVATGMIPPACGVNFQAPGSLWGKVLTVVWVMGVTNAVNLLDNMDGIAAGVAAAAAATLFGLSVASGNALSAVAALALGGAALGFLVVNFPPAKIFMGDCGSMVLGYWLAVTALLAVHASALPFPVPILISAFVLGVPILDTTLVVVLRAVQRRSIFAGGRDHLTHRLVAWGFSEREVAVILYIFTLAAGAAAAVTVQAGGAARVAAVGLGTGLLVFAGVLGSRQRAGPGGSPVAEHRGSGALWAGGAHATPPPYGGSRGHVRS